MRARLRKWLSGLFCAVCKALESDVDPSARPRVAALDMVEADKVCQDPANKIAEGLKSHGQYVKVLTREGCVIAGNHTIIAARQLGWKIIKAQDVDTGEEFVLKL